MKYLSTIFIALFLLNAKADLTVVDFDESIGLNNKPRINLYFREPQGKERLDFFRTLWNKNNPNKITKVNPKYKIPKVIHQIWVGPKPLPKIYLKYQNTCKAMHPDWEFKLWTNKELEKFNLKNRDLFDKAADYREKADIFRYEILKREGGLYLDVDHFCLDKFDDITDRYSFFAGIEPPFYYGMPVISNALIGSYPDNKIFDDILKEIRNKWDVQDAHSFYWVACYRSMLPLTSAFIANTHLHDKSVIFPPTYFIPIYGEPNWMDYTLLENIKSFFDNGQPSFKHIKPESITIHDFSE
jgi:mannosyltransferase OCH1-like enzyme